MADSKCSKCGEDYPLYVIRHTHGVAYRLPATAADSINHPKTVYCFTCAGKVMEQEVHQCRS
jgi:hypothetical protein